MCSCLFGVFASIGVAFAMVLAAIQIFPVGSVGREAVLYIVIFMILLTVACEAFIYIESDPTMTVRNRKIITRRKR